MKVTTIRTLPDTKLSRFRVRDMRHNDKLIAECDNVAEFNSALQNARSGIKESVREDGFVYKLQSFSLENRIEISLHKPE